MVQRGPGLLAAAAALGLALAGCTPAERPSTEPQVTNYAGPPIGVPASTPASAPAPASGTPSAAAPAGAALTAPTAKVSANTASAAEIIAALTRVGVPTPERWAREVVEYRPYPVDDPNLGKLRQDLATSNPGQAVIDKIVSALRP